MPPPLRPAPKHQGSFSAEDLEVSLPAIKEFHTFRQVVRKLSIYFKEVIELPSTFEQLRTTAAGNCLRVLVDHLFDNCSNQATVSALLTLKWHYSFEEDLQGLGPTRSNACEIVAWRFLARHSERVALDYCLYEIPDVYEGSLATTPATAQPAQEEDGELSPLLQRITHQDIRGSNKPAGSTSKRTELLTSLSRMTQGSDENPSVDFQDPSHAFKGLNALEIATVAEAKRFLSQAVVQKILTSIWNGNIVYWDALSLNATKQPRFYQPQHADPYSRLRVPKYMKAWEVVFFGVFICLYYAVLITARKDSLSVVEAVLWFWFASFLFDELSELGDAGSVIYTADIWNLFDIMVLAVGVVYIVMRIVGLASHNHQVNTWAFDILSLEALFLIPRIFSILSLSPYWGTLIPCLKEMAKDFGKFMVLLSIFFIGFLTCFSLIARDSFKLSSMSIILTRIFFGSSYIGFDVMDDIDPVFGPPLMIILVIFSNILLLSSLTSILANSFSRVISHAHEEYLYVYAVYVLEASASNRLVHFYPPFNFISWVVFHPWMVMFPNSPSIRKARITALRVTHLPIVLVIKGYELIRHRRFDDRFSGFKGPDEPKERNGRPSMPQVRPSSADHRPTMPLPRKGRAWKRAGSSDSGDEEDEGTPSMAAQIAELNSKIDNITTALLSMQENQGAKAAVTTEAAAAEEE